MFWRATDRASRLNDRSSKSDLQRPSYEERTKRKSILWLGAGNPAGVSLRLALAAWGVEASVAWRLRGGCSGAVGTVALWLAAEVAYEPASNDRCKFRWCFESG